MKKKYFSDEDWLLLQEEISNGYVNVNKHPTEDLYIYNYTPSCQYDWHWNDITIRCRGLILDGEGYLVAKGFDKFFTDDQLKSVGQEDLIPKNEPYKIYDKVDGSLGVMYFANDAPYIATRGSFVSQMAGVANGWLRGMYGHIVFFPQYTYLFEIIYPENRIVVDYGAERKLVLLAIIDNETLEELDIYDVEFDYIEEQGLERATRFDGYKDWKEILANFEGDKSKEGFVVHFLESNYRVKMKLSWYKEAAYVLQYFTKKSVWRMVRDGKDIEEIIGNIDDEFYPTIRGYYDDLLDEYHDIESRHIDVRNKLISSLGEDYTMKEYAIKAREFCDDNIHHSLLMKLEKGKDLHTDIWRSIEPFGTDHLVTQNI